MDEVKSMLRAVLQRQDELELQLFRLRAEMGISSRPVLERARRPIKFLTGWDKEGNDVYTVREFREKYRIRIDGGNYYYSVAERNANRYASTGRALAPWHRTFFEEAVEALRELELQQLVIVLGLEPTQSTGPLQTFRFMEQNIGLVEQLATELQGFIEEAEGFSKELLIVIRYASEMNAKNVYSNDSAGYLRALPVVRAAFRRNAPSVRFAFSPNVIFNSGPGTYLDYWPDDDSLFDVISCTWYAGEQAHLLPAIQNMRRHLRWAKTLGKPLGVDEMGGGETHWSSEPRLGRRNDEFLESMLTELLDSEYEFEYVTLFLEKWWGTDADLSFIGSVLPDRVLAIEFRERENV